MACFRQEIAHFAVQGKQPGAIPVSHCCFARFHSCSVRHSFPPFSSGVGPAAAMGNVRYLIVPGVTIRHQIAGKAPKEVRGLFSAAIRLVLKDSDGLFASFPAGVYPHPGLRSCRFSILFQYLHSCLIRVNYGVFQQGHLHMPVQRLQSGLGTLDHPVGQCGTAQLHTLSGPDLFLPDHRQSVHILLGHDISHGGGRSQRMLHQGGRRLNSQDVGITSGLFTLVTGVGTAVILQDFFLLWNNDQFPATTFYQ